MQISSYSGAGTTQSLAQLAKLLSQSSASSADTETKSTSATTTSAADPFSESESFFTGALSSGTFGGLLQAQESQGQGHGQRPMGPPPGGADGFQPPSMEDIDSDGDGSLTQAEMESWDASTHGSSDTSKASELFSRMDTDGDGSVTADEKSAFDDQMATRGPGRGGPPQGAAAQTGQTTEGTSSETLAAMMQQLMTALESYSASQASDTSETAVSIAA